MTSIVTIIDLDEENTNAPHTNETSNQTTANSLEDLYVAVDSKQFKEQVQLLANLKQKPRIAPFVKICISCWLLITLNESTDPSHSRHSLTTTFSSMAVCTQ